MICLVVSENTLVHRGGLIYVIRLFCQNVREIKEERGRGEGGKEREKEEGKEGGKGERKGKREGRKERRKKRL